MHRQAEFTRMLRDAGEGDHAAADRLLPVVYDELRRLAESHLRRERPDHTLQATALVHEAYLRMVDQRAVEWRGQAHFFALAAQAIRRVLIDHARKHRSAKRGADRKKFSLDESLTLSNEETATSLVALDEALHRFAQRQPDRARVVELRFFGGLTIEDTARTMGVTTRTVERHWQYARAWLYRDITGEAPEQEKRSSDDE